MESGAIQAAPAFHRVGSRLDFGALQPGAKATDAVRQAASDLDLGGKFGAKVDLTGECR